MKNFASTEKTSEDILCINSCDCQRFSGINAGSRREKGRIDYHILYIAKGICYVTNDGNEVAVCEKSLVIFLPGQPQIYRFKAEDNSISYYIHFCGTYCEKLLKELGLYGKQIIKLGEKVQIENIFEKLIREFHTKKPFYMQRCCGILIDFLTAAARSISIINGNAANRLIYDICSVMHKNYDENIRIGEYARMLNLSTGRFMHLFTQTMGISPKQYLLRIKFEHAVELLSNTDLAVSRIAELVGFSDVNYFSRVFKKHMGHSPTFYR